MKKILQFEMVGLLALSIFLFAQTNFVWWLYPALFFLPDIGMVGYLVNTRVGAFTYNFTHHFALAIFFYVAGTVFANELVQLAGIIMIGHSAFDRVVGYGLKYADSFKHTHLGNL